MSFRRLQSAPSLVLLASLLVFLGFAGEASAQSGAFAVGGVKVDARAETATLARESAIAEGQSRALSRLFRRLVVREDVPRLPQLSPAQVAELVQGFSVADEKTSSGRYLATFTVQFKPNGIRGLLRQARVRFAETVSRPLLVFPVFGAGGSALLWQEPNPWRAAWARATTRGGLVPVEVPLGDLADIGAVTAQQALAGDADALRAVAQRYGGSDIIVAQAQLDGKDLRVDSLQGRPGGLAPAPSVGFQQQPGESRAGLLARAVEDSISRLETAWKLRNAIDYSTQSVLRVAVPFADIRQWAEIRRRLSGVPAIVSSAVTRLKRDRADLTLTVVGRIEQFVQVLAQRDLVLAQPAALQATAGQQATFPDPLAPPPPDWELRLAGAFTTSGGGATNGGATDSGADNFIERVEDDDSSQ